MPDHKNVYEALLAAQGEFPKVEREAPGQIGNQRYKYATLPDLLNALGPILRKHDLLVTQRIVMLPEGLYLETTIHHVPSNEEIVGQVSLPLPDNWQTWGSAVTYARRYSLMPMLGFAPEDDDDGASAQGMAPRQTSAPRPAAAQGGEHGVCAEHGEPYFKTERMRSAAHRLPDGSWCNKPDAGGGAPRGSSRVEPLRNAVFGRLRALEQNNALWPELATQYVPELDGKTVIEWTPGDLATLNDALKAAEGAS